MKYGHSVAAWYEAKQQATDVMVRRVRIRDPISYSALVAEISAMRFRPNEKKFHQMLDEISTSESTAGHGMLSAIVVRKNDVMQPGKGFFDLAQRLGYPTEDKTAFWMKELHKVYDYWSIKK